MPGAGPLLITGQVFAPAPSGGAPARALAPLAAAAVSYGDLAAVADDRGRFTLAADSAAAGLRTLTVRDGGRFELHLPLAARPREQLLLHLQYDAGSGRVYAAEARLDCPDGGATTLRTAVRAHVAASPGGSPREVVSLAPREIAADATEPRALDQIAARLLEALDEARRLETIPLLADPAELLAASVLRFRPFPKGIEIAPATVDLAVGASFPLAVHLTRSDGSVSALPAGASAAFTAAPVARMDGLTVTALSPGETELTFAWNGLVSNAATVRVHPAADAAPPRDGRSP